MKKEGSLASSFIENLVLIGDRDLCRAKDLTEASQVELLAEPLCNQLQSATYADVKSGASAIVLRRS